MEHTSDSASTSSLPDLVSADSDDSSVGIPSHVDRPLILASHTSSLLQPLDTPAFGGYFDEEALERWYRRLPFNTTEGENDTDSDTDDSSTPSLLDLASLSADESSDGNESSEDERHLLATTIWHMDETGFDMNSMQAHPPVRFLQPPRPIRRTRPRANQITRRITVFASLSDYQAFVRERDFEQP